jgi:hypothetical protein
MVENRVEIVVSFMIREIKKKDCHNIKRGKKG